MGPEVYFYRMACANQITNSVPRPTSFNVRHFWRPWKRNFYLIHHCCAVQFHVLNQPNPSHLRPHSPRPTIVRCFGPRTRVYSTEVFKFHTYNDCLVRPRLRRVIKLSRMLPMSLQPKPESSLRRLSSLLAGIHVSGTRPGNSQGRIHRCDCGGDFVCYSQKDDRQS